MKCHAACVVDRAEHQGSTVHNCRTSIAQCALVPAQVALVITATQDGLSLAPATPSVDVPQGAVRRRVDRRTGGHWVRPVAASADRQAIVDPSHSCIVTANIEDTTSGQGQGSAARSVHLTR